jgi:hypothetical protein
MDMLILGGRHQVPPIGGKRTNKAVLGIRISIITREGMLK